MFTARLDDMEVEFYLGGVPRRPVRARAPGHMLPPVSVQRRYVMGRTHVPKFSKEELQRMQRAEEVNLAYVTEKRWGIPPVVNHLEWGSNPGAPLPSKDDWRDQDRIRILMDEVIEDTVDYEEVVRLPVDQKWEIRFQWDSYVTESHPDAELCLDCATAIHPQDGFCRACDHLGVPS